MLRAQTIRNDHAEVLTFLHGNLEACATRCDSPCEAGDDSLVFATSAEQLAESIRRKAAIVIVQEKIAHLAPANASDAGCCFSATDIPIAMAVLLRYFDHKVERFTQWGARHPTSLVHPSATLGQNVVLGPYCVIGARVSVGDGCFIGAHTVVENDVRIGAATILHPHVFVGAACEIGKACEIHPHATIGSNGGVRVDFAGFANLTGCADKNAWMQDRGGPDAHVVLAHRMRADETAIANRHSRANHAIRAKDHVLTERGTRMHQ